MSGIVLGRQRQADPWDSVVSQSSLLESQDSERYKIKEWIRPEKLLLRSSFGFHMYTYTHTYTNTHVHIHIYSQNKT